MKRILIINDIMSATGGAEKVVNDLKLLLETNGHEVRILTSSDSRQSLYSFFRSFFSFKYFFTTLKVIDKFNPDLVHIHNISRHISPSPIIAAKIRKKPIIMTIHDFIYYCPRARGINWENEVCPLGYNVKCFYKNCISPRMGINNILFNFLKAMRVGLHRYIINKYVKIFICPSKQLRSYAIKSLNLSETKVLHVPNFINIPQNYIPNLNNIDDKYFLYVGRISKEKGVDVAIKAINYLVKQGLPDIRFDIIGGGGEKEKLKEMVQKLGLQNSIKFLGRIDNNKLGEYYNKACAILMPSVWLENNPLVALEAMKFGRPIIATDIGGYSDLIENGKNGYLFHIGRYEELGKKIEALYKNKTKSILMGQYGFEKVKKEFNVDIYYHRLNKIYSQ